MERKRYLRKELMALLSEKGWQKGWHILHIEVTGRPGHPMQPVLILQHRPHAPMGILVSDSIDNHLRTAALYAGQLNLPFLFAARATGFRQFQVREGGLSCRTDWLDWNAFPTPEELWRQSEAWAFHDYPKTTPQGGEPACPLNMGLSPIQDT